MTQKNKFSNIAVSGLALTLVISACGILPDSKKIDYKSAKVQTVPSLEVPPDLTQVTKDDRFKVPNLQGKGKATYSTYAAERTPEAQVQTSPILPTVDKVRIERSGDQRWLVVSMPTDRVWESVKEFWQEMGFVINLELPEAGIIETDWAENRAKIPDDFLRRSIGKLLDSLYSSGERDKFRTRLEQGATLGVTEVYISHRGMEEVYTSQAKDETRWQPRKPDPELEAEMLRRFMVRLGSDDKRAEAAVVATAIGANADRAKIVEVKGAAAVEVFDRFDRAWRRVGLALDRVGFTVEDRDRSKGIYLVRYVDPDAHNQKPETLFSKMAFWKDSKKSAPRTLYRVLIQEESGNSRVYVQTREGEYEPSETTARILDLLLGQLK
jgi:outer membrane protein assembly factor BamC